MRKRLRKKKHLRDFQQFGVNLVVNLHDGVDFDAFFDDFLVKAVEANGLAFGGGGCATILDGFLELGCRSEHEINLSTVAVWLTSDSRVQSSKFGTPVDAWYPG